MQLPGANGDEGKMSSKILHLAYKDNLFFKAGIAGKLATHLVVAMHYTFEDPLYTFGVSQSEGGGVSSNPELVA